MTRMKSDEIRWFLNVMIRMNCDEMRWFCMITCDDFADDQIC